MKTQEKNQIKLCTQVSGNLADFINIMSHESKGRKCSRVDFEYPVEFKLSSPNLLSRTFIGSIRDISLNGVCIQFEDKYGRFNMIETKGSEIELLINMSHGNSVSLMASISWIKKALQSEDASLFMGLEFKDISDSQIEIIGEFFNLKDKDQTMMWNLCDYYISKSSK